MISGRFAPSPTGPLHMGSLLTALASFLQARQQGGRWYIRIDDIDPPRASPGAEAAILHSLHAHGLHHDGDVMRQSTMETRYREALTLLEADLFFCDCTRKALKATPVYPGTCRSQRVSQQQHWLADTADRAIRIDTEGMQISLQDGVLGPCTWHADEDFGDLIVRRKDGLWAYNFATAVDDGHDFNQVVRGQDLLDTTPQQCTIMRKLGLTPPEYAHIPLLCFENGDKLSKQTHAPPLDDERAAQNLRTAFSYLGMHPPATTKRVDEWLSWALNAWDLSRLPGALTPYQSDLPD